MKLTEKDRQQLLENFDERIDELYPLEANFGSTKYWSLVNIENRTEYKQNKNEIVDEFIKFVNNQDDDLSTCFIKKLKTLHKTCEKNNKINSFIDNAINIWNLKKEGKICIINKSGEIEAYEDKLPDIEYVDYGDLPEADF